MTLLFGFLLKFLGGGVLDGILKAIQGHQDAKTEREALKRDVVIAAIEAEIASRQAQADIVKAEQGVWYTAIIRPLFALPFVVYIWKLVVWDKVLGLGTTDTLSPELWTLCTTIVAAYFVSRGVEKIARSYLNRK